MSRAIICGGRKFKDYDYLCKVLDHLSDLYDITVVIEGEAKGVDTLARRWAEERELKVIPFEADWDTYGRKAGPIRNRRMLQESDPNLVIAFPGGKGTANMVKQALAFRVKVIQVEPKGGTGG